MSQANSTPLDWQPFLDLLDRSESFVLTTHVRPDTDGIGSAIALHRGLVGRGKRARILNSEPLPPHLQLLDPDGVIEAAQPSDVDWIRGATLIVLDVCDRARLGPLTAMLDGFAGESVCIDHHIGGRKFATLNLIDPTAPATGVLVWDALAAMGSPIDPVTAQALYATIVADTGSFRFSNTTSRVLRIAADLVELGAQPAKIARAVLGAYSAAKMSLLGHTLSTAEYSCDRRLTWCVVPRDLLASTAATVGDTDGLVEYLRLDQTVRVAILFVELDDLKVKLSLRSEEGVDVNAVAVSLGGGGHRYAAGAVIDGALDDVVRRVVETAETLFVSPKR